MKICLIVEGCYPYVAGGVSSWIQMLIEGLPQHEFIILTIGAEEKQRGDYKYTLPKNVARIEEHFLDESLKTKQGVKRNKHSLNELQKQELIHFIEGSKVEWNHIFTLSDGLSILSSKAFLEIIKEVCAHKYQQFAFNELFWMVRSMLLPLIELLDCRAPEADIYHSVSTGYAGIIGAKFKWQTGKPFILTEHGIYTREREEEILKADWVKHELKENWIQFFMSMSASAYQYNDVTISLFYHAKQMQIELGAQKQKCRVIANGIDVEHFSQVAELSSNKESLVIGGIVRVVPIKDIKTMIYSFNLVKRELPDARLLIIGPYDENPEYYQECLELIERLDCEGIEFTGRVDVSKWMEQLDIVLLSSVSEGQPFVLLEAMAAKRPVISTDVGCCREIVEGIEDDYGQAGLIVPVMNPNLMANAIVKLGKDRRLMRQMGENGYNRVRHYFTKKAFLNHYDTVYSEVSL